jgi:MraZ protein
MIPQRLREYAGLERDLTVNGADERLEIWDRALWEQYRERAEETFATLDGGLS